MDHMQQSDDPLVKARQKVRVWKREVERVAAPVHLHDGFDLTLSPSEARATFPGLVPFRILTASDVVFGKDKLVSVPSISGTTCASACAGAVVTLLVFLKPLLRGLWKHDRPAHEAAVGAAPTPSRLAGVLASVGAIATLFRFAVAFVALLWCQRFIASRYPQVRAVSRYKDVSGTPEAGPCIVVDRLLIMTNSHVGTHADMPAHFVHRHGWDSGDATLTSGTWAFDEAHYTGDAVVLDVAAELAQLSGDTNAMTVEVVDTAVAKLPPEYLSGTKQLWRLVFVTRRLRIAPGSPEDSKWDPMMAYFTPEAVEFLCRKFPLLLLVAIDTASVDAPATSPIGDASHGTLMRNGVAFVENLRCNDLYNTLAFSETPGVMEGSLMTVFNPFLSFEDSRACSVIFFPKHQPHKS